MTHPAIEFIVVISLFVVGISWTIFRYGQRERIAFTVIAIISPVLLVISAFMLLFDVLRGNFPEVGPCPPGLSEAERMVEEERQRMFGGQLRQPSFSLRWQRAYEIELQRGAERVQRGVDSIFAHA
jgi:hypothetical protein